MAGLTALIPASQSSIAAWPSLEVDFRGLTQIVVGAVGTLNVLADRVTDLERAVHA